MTLIRELSRRGFLNMGAAAGLGDFGFGEDAVLEPLAITRERIADPLDVAEVGADADDQRASSINARMRRTLASRPVKIASPIR